MCERLPLLLFLTLTLALPVTADEKVWIELRAPTESSVVRVPIPYVEVRGVAGAGRGLMYDVVVIVDLSVSTRLPSGVDADGDGFIGQSAPEISEDYWGSAAPEQLCDDPGDTIAAAEIEAARRLLGILDPEVTRVGLVAFGDRGQLEAPVGSSRAELSAALDRIDKKHGWYGGTNYASAIRTALDALRDAPATHAPDVRRTILFLSDGFPTMPIPPETRPNAAALEAAAEAGDAGATLHAIALGPEAIKAKELLVRIAVLTRGTLDLLERPGDVLFQLPLIELSEITGVKLWNKTLGREGRAVRHFPDGGFDGFAPLAPGANTLRIEAHTATGVRGVVERTVRYEPESPTSPEGKRELREKIEALKKLLRDRSLEIELGAEIKRKRDERRRREKALRIEVEE